MNHDEARLLLAELPRGRLDEKTRSELQAHEAGCDECRALTGAYVLFSSALGDEAGGRTDAHPSSEEIVSFALRAESVAAETFTRVATHAGRCVACSGEIETVRKAEESIQPRLVRLAKSSLGRFLMVPQQRFAAALAAAVVILVLGYPAYLGLHRLPRIAAETEGLRQAKDLAEGQVRVLNSELDQTRQRLGRAIRWAGPAQWIFLKEQRRGDRPAEPIRLREDQPFVLIAVQPRLPGSAKNADSCRVEIRSENGDVSWWSDLTIAQVREDLTAFDVVTLPVPATSLPPGDYELRILSGEGPDGVPLLNAGFSIVP